MPSTITHDYHYKYIYNFTSSDFKNIYSQEIYNEHSIFAQGHDALFFSDFWKLHKFNQKRNKALYLQDHLFQELCINFTDLLKTYELKDSKTLKLLLYGYIAHHILDSYVHPYIIYETEINGMHEKVETYFDKYMILQREKKCPNNYKIYKMISNPPKLMEQEMELTNEAFLNTYGFEQFGQTYIDALNQVNLFLRLFRYDPTGIKNLCYCLIDKINPTNVNLSFLSYNHNDRDLSQYLNNEHHLWFNPSEPSAKITSTNSFVELYELATKKTAEIISCLEEAINDNATHNEIQKIVPNVSAVHGLECDLNLPFKTLKKTKF